MVDSTLVGTMSSIVFVALSRYVGSGVDGGNDRRSHMMVHACLTYLIVISAAGSSNVLSIDKMLEWGINCCRC